VAVVASMGHRKKEKKRRKKGRKKEGKKETVTLGLQLRVG
jgi:hypothetical protein